MGAACRMTSEYVGAQGLEAVPHRLIDCSDGLKRNAEEKT